MLFGIIRQSLCLTIESKGQTIMLKRVEIEGFKSIKQMKLDLRALNIFIGPNGVGKSNFIALFNLIERIVEGKLQLFIGESGGADSLLYFGRKITNELLVKLEFDKNTYEFGLVPTKDNTLVFSKEDCYFHANGYPIPYHESFGSGHKETILSEKRLRGVGRFTSKAIKSWKIYHFHDTSDSSKIKQLGDINDNYIFKPDGSNLAAFLLFLKSMHPQHYQNIIDTIRMVAPFFDDFILRPSQYNPNQIQLEWREKDSDVYFNAHSFSDGTLRFICLATLLQQPDLPSLILLDEPELGLHPYAITLLADLLRSASSKTQVIVSTQSVTLVNKFEPVDVIVVERQENQSIFNQLSHDDMKDWLEEYGLGDLWEKNIIGGRP